MLFVIFIRKGRVGAKNKEEPHQRPESLMGRKTAFAVTLVEPVKMSQSEDL